MEAKLKQARLDLETLKSINKAFEDHKAITDNAITSFDLASQMYNNISTTSALAEKQGLGMKLTQQQQQQQQTLALFLYVC